MKRPILLLGFLASTVACGELSKDEGTGGSGGALSGGAGQGTTGGRPSGGASATGGTAGATAGVTATGGTTGGLGTGGSNLGGSSTTGGSAPIAGTTPVGGSSAGSTQSGGTAGVAAGSGGQGGGSGGSDGGSAGSGAQSGGGGDTGGQSGAAGSGGGSASNCVGGKAWPTADPTRAGQFQVTAEKNVGPLAGVVPDPIYGNEQQRFNVYRPSNLADSGYCHPILIWANGYRDNPEQNPPECVVDQGSNQWCGQYLPMLNHLASHGFVVVAPLSTATAEGDPLPTLAGMDWILEEAADPSSKYYGRLDTNSIGQLGHSYGGMSTCMSASDPRYKALMTICGTRALSGVHTPMLFFCGGRDSTVNCSGVRNTFLSVTDQPAFFLNELDADHGSWVYEGAGGVSLSSAAAWFRVHLMNDTENRKFFYGTSCTFCRDNRVEAEQNSLMAQ